MYKEIETIKDSQTTKQILGKMLIAVLCCAVYHIGKVHYKIEMQTVSCGINQVYKP